MKIINKITIVFLSIFILFMFASCNKGLSSKDAEKNNTDVNIRVVNKTGQVINQIKIIADEDKEAAKVRTNPESDNDSDWNFQIYDAFKEKEKFTIIMQDRYGLLYEKTIENPGTTGLQEVVIDTSDQQKQSGDFRKKIEKWLNGNKE